MTAPALRELLQLCRDNRDFYQSAAASTDNLVLRNVFQHLARLKSRLLAELAAAGADAGFGADRLALTLRQLYALIGYRLDDDRQARHLAWLEAVEGWLLQGLREGLSADPTLRPLLYRHLPALQAGQSELRQLRRTLRNPTAVNLRRYRAPRRPAATAGGSAADPGPDPEPARFPPAAPPAAPVPRPWLAARYAGTGSGRAD